MTTFDDREKAYEKKFALDQELMFKAHARRDKLFGLWAAGQMGLSGSAAEDYARGIVTQDISHPGDKGIATKVASDLKAKGVKVPAGELESKLEELLATAQKQVVAEAKP